ncbi:C-terminal domain phosphatase-like 3 [Tasmannia lanceolata]|uniref:C-terminal domain phosphatase-like 3 n=1 Tax=Tasmannia lanceolata TaxID=3420 RepID=UPI0040628246
MLVAESNRFFSNPNEAKTLNRMANNGSLIEDIEEGEISDDSASSVVEISECDFKKDDRVSRSKGGNSRVWVQFPHYTPDLYNLAWAQAVQNKPLSDILVRRDFGSEERSNSSKSVLVNSRDDSKKGLNVKEICPVLIDDSGDELDDKVEGVGVVEKGELEEGEIDLDDELVETSKEEVITVQDDLPPIKSNEEEFEKRVNSITEVLKTVTEKEAEKSFHDVCSRIQTSMENVQLMILENRIRAVDALVEQTFTGIQTVHSVFCDASSKQREHDKDTLLRLLSHVKSQDPAIFSPEQMKEIETMIGGVEKDKEIYATVGANSSEYVILDENSGNGLITTQNYSEPVPVDSGAAKYIKNGSEALKIELSFSSKGRGDFGPLLDLHADHDEGSLPSPTRENPSSLLARKPQAAGDGVDRTHVATGRLEETNDAALHPYVTDEGSLPSPTRENPPSRLALKPQAAGDGVVRAHVATGRLEETDDAVLHPYVTDALKAVSSYQQKFGRSSFLSSYRLPSPTPSEEGENEDGDSHEEVSSSSAVGNVGTVNSSILFQPSVSTSVHMDGLIGPGQVAGKTVAQLSTTPNSILKASTKSRDPRLRFANSDLGAYDVNKRPLFVGGMTNSRKHRVEETGLDDPTLKRQKNGLTDARVSRDLPLISGKGGRLEDSSIPGPQPPNKDRIAENMEIDTQKLENGEVVSEKRLDTSANFRVSNGGSMHMPVAAGTGPAVSLPSLLKDIAVNPTILMHLIMEQQRLASEARQNPADMAQQLLPPSSSNILSGSVSSGNVASSKPSELEQRPAGNPQTSVQTASTNTQSERGRVRMKPRDPRRILHNNIAQKCESTVSDQFKSNGALSSSVQGSKDNLKVREQNDLAVMSCLPLQSAPLPDIAPQFTKNLKNIADLFSSSQVIQNVSQPVLSTTDSRVVIDPNAPQIGTVLTCEEGTMAPSQQQNPWGDDLEHLFEGYDDQQKAAIQRERARRIEEQNKMFASRKLCLVLDLDHTLLNSAKFVEVDHVHAEILRKKEEQDREKSHRHLFRFTHMGMWTKLRPGVWNFLEKASKLYELHLYTMGNKLYATEMAKVLDPTGALFAGRVISRGDDGDPFDGDERVPKSKDLEGVLGMESAVVIIDDSVRVWPHNKHNLIVVERYTYFPCSRRQFGLPGPSLLEIDHDERPEDGTLASSLAVIEKLHQIFFSHRSLNDVDVRNILASEQRKILSGCRIVFSRIFPVGEANPHLHPLWQTAEQFGAICTNQLDDQVTHVVANSLGTDKVNWALSTGKFVVHPGWVEASALLYRRVNERDFAVK